MSQSSPSSMPEGVFSFLDTDLYKLTMQCAVLQYFPSVKVEYAFTNRTPQMRLNRKAFDWLQLQISKLANIELSTRESDFLRKECPYLTEDYLEYLRRFRLRPGEQVRIEFVPVKNDAGAAIEEEEYGDLKMRIEGLWVETILYEIPLLALTSEAYFKFVDRDWSHEGQEEQAFEKGIALLKAGCLVSEFGSRRRRDFHTQDLVVKGLTRAVREQDLSGRITGTSNVYFAMKYKIPPVGTVAHEWYMGIAALTNDYENANELGLRYWLDCFGRGVLGVALTDTFGTPAFFKAFQKQIPSRTSAERQTMRRPSIDQGDTKRSTYVEIFTGIRQDSGDPKDYVKMASEFYESVQAKKRNIVFSDSLNIEKCLEYKEVAERYGFTPSFGVGTFFTNDYSLQTDPSTKSKPMNIVIKISKAGGQPAIKISDNIGKNTGDENTVKQVKSRLGYEEHDWQGVKESQRW